MNRRVMGLLTTLCAFAFSAAAAPEDAARPWTYWDWMGNAVDKPTISALLEQYAAAGLGGVHIIPIYGVKGEESRFIEYLSPQWMDMLAHTVSEAQRLGMGVDMSTGTGWPFGGPNVTDAMAAAQVKIDPQPLQQGQPLAKPLPEHLLSATASYADGRRADVTADVKAGNWTAPGNGTLFCMWVKPSVKVVERSAPGGEGFVVDPFSPESLRTYLARFDEAFADYKGPLPRAQYHDSYEYEACATYAILDLFAQQRGYDLRPYLPELSGEGDPDTVARVRYDFRRTCDEQLQQFTKTWVDWSHSMGFLTRNQAHGSPGSLLDLYALADIPETEIFGPSNFPIPGLRKDASPESEPPNPLINKLASSAAHVAGHPLVSSESCTWLGEHFRIPLSLAKPELDQLFTSGVNHIFYHTLAYSPPDAPWPGWLFYASTNFSPSANPQWPHFFALNDYVARAQTALREGKPDNDVLLYFPIHDVFQQVGKGFLSHLTVHDAYWLDASGMGEAARWLWSKGYGFDYVSDKQLLKAKVDNGRIRTEGAEYATLVVPRCQYMQADTLKQILDLAKQGVAVLFPDGLPKDVPGLHDLDARRKAFAEVCAAAPALPQGDLPTLISATSAEREPLVEQNLRFIRRERPDGHTYFITNLSDRAIDGWIPIGTHAAAAVLTDPMHANRTGRATWADTDTGGRCFLQLAPGESVVLRTYTRQAPETADWPYLRVTAEAPVPVNGSWNVTFLEGGPTLPEPHTPNALESWTNWGETASQFAGLARYRTTFPRPAGNAQEWLLDLGDVRETARIYLNGREVTTLVALPFRVPIGEFLKDGDNELTIEVTNLGANRIAAMDRQGIEWRRFYEINFVNILYKPFDASGWEPVPSGLLGPITLIPCDRVTNPKEEARPPSSV